MYESAESVSGGAMTSGCGKYECPSEYCGVTGGNGSNGGSYSYSESVVCYSESAPCCGGSTDLSSGVSDSGSGASDGSSE